MNDNIVMLRGAFRDPMSAVVPLMRTAEKPDTLRLEMMRRWIRHNHRRRATPAAAFFTDTALRSQADELLRGQP
jgi:hypothetical protein